MLLALFRLVTALLLPLALVAGLLTFPTSCACGSSLPHDHPLLALSGHQHGQPGHDHARDHDANATTSRTPASADDTAEHQHQLRAPSGGSAAGRAPLAPVSLALVALPARRARRTRPARATCPPGEPATPDDPPPQPRTPR